HDRTPTGASSVEPALLSLFCHELNEERKRLGKSKLDQQLLDGAKRDVLSNYYESCIRGLSPRVSRFIEPELITNKGFRNSYAGDDAVPSQLTADELGLLIRSRLVRLEERYGTKRIELTHDILTPIVRERRDQWRIAREKQEIEQAAAHREAELVMAR